MGEKEECGTPAGEQPTAVELHASTMMFPSVYQPKASGVQQAEGSDPSTLRAAYSVNTVVPVVLQPEDEVAAEVPQWEADVRTGFIRKVLFIVGLQLLFTTAVTCSCLTIGPLNTYLTTNMWPMLAFCGSLLVLMLVAYCSEALRRTYPYNHILLAMFTFVMASFAGSAAAHFEPRAVGIAVVVTTAAVLGCCAIAMRSKVDLTDKGFYIAPLIFSVSGLLICGLLFASRWYQIVVSAGFALLFMVMLVWDLQMLMGNGRHALSPDEYVYAAMTIYSDIIHIFLHALFFSSGGH